MLQLGMNLKIKVFLWIRTSWARGPSSYRLIKQESALLFVWSEYLQLCFKFGIYVKKEKKPQQQQRTRMHSSRMRTDRCSGHRWMSVPGGGRGRGYPLPLDWAYINDVPLFRSPTGLWEIGAHQNTTLEFTWNALVPRYSLIWDKLFVKIIF